MTTEPVFISYSNLNKIDYEYTYYIVRNFPCIDICIFGFCSTPHSMIFIACFYCIIVRLQGNIISLTETNNTYVLSRTGINQTHL